MSENKPPGNENGNGKKPPGNGDGKADTPRRRPLPHSPIDDFFDSDLCEGNKAGSEELSDDDFKITAIRSREGHRKSAEEEIRRAQKKDVELGDSVSEALPRSPVEARSESPAPSDVQQDAETIDVSNAGADTFIDLVHKECKEHNIHSMVDFMKRLPELAAEAADRELLGKIFVVRKNGQPKKKKQWSKSGSAKTKIDGLSRLPGNKMAALNDAEKRAAEANGKRETSQSDNGRTEDLDDVIAPRPPDIFEPERLPEQQAPASSKSGVIVSGLPSEEPVLPENLEKQREIIVNVWIDKMTELVDSPPEGEEEMRQARTTLEQAALAYNRMKDGLHSHFGSEYVDAVARSVSRKAKLDQPMEAIEEVVMAAILLGQLIEEFQEAQQEREAQSVSIQVPATPVKQAKPVEDVKDSERPKEKKRRFARLRNRLASPMTAAVVSTSALSCVLHARNAFQEAALTIKTLLEKVFHSPIEVTAQQVMYGFYTVVGFMGALWLRELWKESKGARRIKKDKPQVYDYVRERLKAIRGSSSDLQTQVSNLTDAMVGDEMLFQCMNGLYGKPNSVTSDDNAAIVMYKAGLSLDLIDNFHICFENAETEIMLKRFRELAVYYGNDAERKKKLRNLMEDPDQKIFREKLEELFERNEKGVPKYPHKRAKYENARVGGTWGNDLLKRLEGDYIDMQEERKSLY